MSGEQEGVQNPYNSSDSVSHQKYSIELEFHNCILQVLIEKSVQLSP